MKDTGSLGRIGQLCEEGGSLIVLEQQECMELHWEQTMSQLRADGSGLVDKHGHIMVGVYSKLPDQDEVDEAFLNN